MSQTVLVTGGRGYVAGWCVVQLLERGYSVRTTLRDRSKEQALRAAVGAVTDPGDRLSVVTADLTADEGWAEAVAGCDHILHIASPLGTDSPRDKDALLAPARDGALRVLAAATRAGVRRIVMTSACAAATPLMSGPDGTTDESVWSDPDDPSMTAYRTSKVVAERAAWDFMSRQEGRTTLTTILPGAVFGPLLWTDNLGSVQIIKRMLEGKVPGTPRIGLEVVDVRDLADAHIRAMESPAAAGERIIAAGDFLWMSEIAQALRAGLGDAARKTPTRRLPDIAVKIAARFDPGLRAVRPVLGHRHLHSSAKAGRLLGWEARPGIETVVACAQDLIAKQVVRN